MYAFAKRAVKHELGGLFWYPHFIESFLVIGMVKGVDGTSTSNQILCGINKFS